MIMRSACAEQRGRLGRSIVSGIVVGLAATACSSDAIPPAAIEPAATELAVSPEDETAPAAGEAGMDTSEPDAASLGGLLILPVREGPRRETTGNVPHIQLDAELVPEVNSELMRRASMLPGVENRESARSLPGATGFWLAGDVALERGDILGGGNREFAHVHPDGSLHIFLPEAVALEVDRTKWGELHPWVERDGFWEGVTMVYTPETLAELDITIQLLVEAYNFVVGAAVEPGDLV